VPVVVGTNEVRDVDEDFGWGRLSSPAGKRIMRRYFFFVGFLGRRKRFGPIYVAAAESPVRGRRSLDGTAIRNALHDRVCQLIRVFALGELHRDAREALSAQSQRQGSHGRPTRRRKSNFRVREDADGLVEAGVRPFELVLQFQTLEAASIGIGHVRKRDMK